MHARGSPRSNVPRGMGIWHGDYHVVVIIIMMSSGEKEGGYISGTGMILARRARDGAARWRRVGEASGARRC